MTAKKIIDPEVEAKFRHIQKCALGNNGVVTKYRRLSDVYHLGSKDVLKNLVSGLFISLCLNTEDFSISAQESFEKLSHYFKMIIDVNGLKSVNEWGSHEKGDILLERIVFCLLYDEVIVNFIKHFDIHFPKKNEDGSFVFVSWGDLREADVSDYFIPLFREGGDEFSMICYVPGSSATVLVPFEGWDTFQPNESSKRLSILAVFRSLIVVQVSKIYIGDLVDHQCVIDKVDEFGFELYDATKGNFKFCASVAGGEITLDQVLLNYLNKHDVLAVDWSRVLFGDSLMGATQNSVDKIINTSKGRYKTMLMKSKDPCAVFEGYLITRSEEARRLYGLVKKIQHKTEEMVDSFYKSQAEYLFSLKKELVNAGVEKGVINDLIYRAGNNLDIFSKSLPGFISKIINDKL